MKRCFTLLAQRLGLGRGALARLVRAGLTWVAEVPGAGVVLAVRSLSLTLPGLRRKT